jgi:hypothetical protein
LNLCSFRKRTKIKGPLYFLFLEKRNKKRNSPHDEKTIIAP